MKKLLFLLIFLPILAFGQSSKNYVYCELVGTQGVFSSKVTVSIDFGQATGFFSDKTLKDQNGKTIKFNSMVDALNYMGGQGWEFVQAFTIGEKGSFVYHYLMKKEVTKEDLDKILSEKSSKKSEE